MLQTKVLDNIKHILITFFYSFCLWDMWEKYGRAEQATDDNIAYTFCMLDT